MFAIGDKPIQAVRRSPRQLAKRHARLKIGPPITGYRIDRGIRFLGALFVVVLLVVVLPLSLLGL